MDLNNLLRELNYSTDIENSVKNKFYKDELLIKEIAETAYSGEDFNFPLIKRMPLTRLTVIIWLLLQKYAEYKALGIPDNIIFDTFRDVSLRADLFYEKNNKAGLSIDDVIWFRHIMNINIFKIGSLQFQPFSMVYLDEETIGEPYMEFSHKLKESLPNGTPVINCHIQKGADLSPASIEDSFLSAQKFFKKYFPAIDFKAFLCYSWLLYPPMAKHLPDQSNIKSFADRFIIIGSCNDSDQAMENILGQATNIKQIPNVTSLQKMAVSHKKLFGYACGIIII